MPEELFVIGPDRVPVYVGEPPAEILHALDIEIARWRFVARHPEIKHDGGGSTSPLCRMFTKAKLICSGCPISSKTGQSSCRRAPHGEVYEAFWGRDPKKIAAAAEKMGAFVAEVRDELQK